LESNFNGDEPVNTISGQVKTAYSSALSSEDVAHELSQSLADSSARVIMFFCAHTRDGALISRLLKERHEGAVVIGCTSAGEYTDAVYGRGGVAAMAIPASKINTCAATLARFDESVEAGIAAACERLSAALGSPLRDIDPKRHVGLVLIEGAKGNEESVNEFLGNAAPFLSFVGGSAGDDIAFRRTELFLDGESTDDGAALLVMELNGPFAVVKTCNYEPTEHSVTITKLGGPRVVLELDGRPARQVYAELLGVDPAVLAHEHFLTRPLGLIIEGQPWLRSVLALPEEPGSLMMACQLVEGMELSVMRPLDIIRDTLAAMDRAQHAMQRPIAGAIHFDCAYRRLEIEVRKLQTDYHRAISRQPLLGLHTHGESWLGHINQTLTSLVFA
jgi:hypothetical protein